MMKISLPVMCRSFRQTKDTQTCAIHGTCAVLPEFAKCKDFQPVKRAIPSSRTATCDCAADGYCERYKKPMRGRDRQICRGENVDPGEAANLRALWAQEAAKKPAPIPINRCQYLGDAIQRDGENVKRKCRGCGGTKERQVFACTHPAREPDQVTVEDCSTCLYRPRALTGKPIILRNRLCPGDVLVMSAAIHSLHKAYPGKFVVAVDTSADELFEHNPDVVSMTELRECERISGAPALHVQTHYPAVGESNERGITFLQAYCEHLGDSLGVKIPLKTNRPMAYLSARERGGSNPATGNWLICSGGKSDFTNKLWPYYQEVVNALRGQVRFVQVGHAEHEHKPLAGAVNLIGQTSLRQLMQLVHRCDGVLCGVTLLQHLAAAFEKPAVVVMGGREPVQWNSYPKQHLLHTIGQLDCCRTGGCWKSRIVPLGDGTANDSSLCEQPKTIFEGTYPRCMADISAKQVIDKIMLFAVAK